MNRQNMLYAYSGISFSIKEDGNSALWDNVDEPGRNYAKWNKPGTEGQKCMTSLTWETQSTQKHRSRE